MERALACKDVGIDCPFVAKGKDDAEVLKKAEEHALKVHHMEKMPPEMQATIRSKIHDA